VSQTPQARQVADQTAEAAGVVLRDLHDHGPMGAVSALFDAVWGRAGEAGAIMPPEALTALAHAGGQVTGAYRDDRLVGATAAFLGLDDGEVFLHSHVTGVVADAVGAGVGRALKWWQRAWCLERDIARVRWTFDPLIRRNAVFNLVHLGARVVAYEQDRYGPMQDERNAGNPTDRLVADWHLTEARVAACAGGRSAEPDVAALRRGGAAVALEVDADGAPHVVATDAPRRLVQVPPDIERLRHDDRDLAAAWAAAVRATLGGALDAGFRVSGCTRDGWYVLAAQRTVDELA
jgi:predicted GNAT superfamily acetyltransferase